MIATYYGMHPVSPERCRVLELGCAAGGNIVPMAEQFPRSEFVGLDASARQISSGQERVARLGLKNIQLLVADLLNWDGGDQQFDYIICHGVYSWVPPAVRETILKICKRHLSPQGVAYISYNTFPGWRARGMMVDLLKHHTRRVPKDGSPEDRAAEARKLLELLRRE